MEKQQINIRLSPTGRKLLSQLADKMSRETEKETGRKTTQTDVVERALRCLENTLRNPGKCT